MEESTEGTLTSRGLDETMIDHMLRGLPEQRTARMHVDRCAPLNCERFVPFGRILASRIPEEARTQRLDDRRCLRTTRNDI